MAKIIIPTPLRKYTDQQRSFETQKSNLSEAIQDFVGTHPQIKNNLLDEQENVRSYIKFYIGDDEVVPSESDEIALQEDTEVSIIPAIAGGAGF